MSQLAGIPGDSITEVYHQFITLFEQGFTQLQSFSIYLVGVFLVIECVFLGIAWALSRDVSLYHSLTKVLLVGAIVFLVTNFSIVIEQFLAGFDWLASTVLQGSEFELETPIVEAFRFEPGVILRQGHDAGTVLLYHNGQRAWPKLFTMEGMLGVGLIFNFALITIQLVCVSVMFYGVALVSLILIPLGIYSPARDFLNTPLRQMLSIALRALGLILVVAALQTSWSHIDVASLKQQVTLERWLGPYFISLTFTILSFAFPKALAGMVGHIGARRGEASGSHTRENAPVWRDAPELISTRGEAVTNLRAAASTLPGAMIATPASLASGARSQETTGHPTTTAMSSHDGQTVLPVLSNRDVASAPYGYGEHRGDSLNPAPAGATLQHHSLSENRKQKPQLQQPYWSAHGPTVISLGSSDTQERIDSLVEAVREAQKVADERAHRLENIRIAAGRDEDEENDVSPLISTGHSSSSEGPGSSEQWQAIGEQFVSIEHGYGFKESEPPVRPLLWGLGVCIAIAVLCCALVAAGWGLTWQGSSSMPRGWYLLTPVGRIAPGDIVAFHMSEVLRDVEMTRRTGETDKKRERDMLVLKPVLAMAGQHVCIRDDMLFVDGSPVVRRESDPTVTVVDFCKHLANDQVLLISKHHWRSWDGRYFGPIPKTGLKHRAIPL